MTELEARRRMLALDGIRGIAVLLVLAHNFDVLGGPLSRVGTLLDRLMDGGWLGVQIFFVLSGFLITGILLDGRREAHYYRSFMVRRVLRIFPLYYAVLCATFVVVPLVTGHAVAGHEHQAWLWTYTSNWAEPFGREVPLFPHFWSLAIEEQFYLAWPFIVRVLSPRSLMRFCVGLAVAALLSRIALRAAGLGSAGPYMFTICRVDALALGAIAAILFRSPHVVAVLSARRGLFRGLTLGLILVTVLMSHGAPRTGLLMQTVGYSAFAVTFAALVLDAALSSHDEPDALGRVLRLAPLRSVGKYSYAMYVFHTPLHRLVGLPLLARITAGAIGPVLGLAYFTAATVATYVAAFLSFHFLEKHFLQMKRAFEPRTA
ncbi:acyltransferase family protein [Pendulispora albinea]|uniref:Acyltransferase n=1 Tax=Pendulispora albinea TaxID=2741071 RepID=A0ABZ2M704_9BACT